MRPSQKQRVFLLSSDQGESCSEPKALSCESQKGNAPLLGCAEVDAPS